MKRVFNVLAFLAFLLVAILFGGALWLSLVYAPGFVREKVETAALTSCDDCHLTIDSVETPLVPFGTVILRGVHLYAGETGGTEVDVKIERISAHLSLRDTNEHSLHLVSLEIDSPHVLFTDGDQHSKSRPTSGKDESLRFAIDETSIKQGVFNYLRNTHGTSAKLRVHDIGIELGRLTNDPTVRDEKVKGSVLAQIEKSGTVELEVHSSPFSENLFVDVDFRVRDQNLADLTPFLKENAGVELTGVMNRGHSVIRIRDRHESARVWAEYHGLKVKLNRMYDRSEIVAFFTSLGADLTMSDDNADKPTEDQTRTVQATRKQGESIVGFIVRGMKEAAIKVAQAK